jgi:protein-tyrosine phosphatase
MPPSRVIRIPSESLLPAQRYTPAGRRSRLSRERAAERQSGREIVPLLPMRSERSTRVAQIAGGADRSILGMGDIQDIISARDRHIRLAGLFNLRDAGGFPTVAGGRVRWRTLFRSDALGNLDQDGIATLAEFGLRTIVDLRTHIEAELAPSAVAGLDAQTIHISLLSGDLQALPYELGEIYRYMIDERGGAIAAAIKALSARSALPALVHCSAGKDRTGIVIALILAVLGVPDQVIAADYALSARYLDPENAAAIRQLQASCGLGDNLTTGLLVSPPALILEVLARTRAIGGSVDGYLLDHGVRQADLAALRAALVGPA